MTAPKRAQVPTSSTTPGRHGKLLFAFLTAEWEALKTNMTAWCRQNDIPFPTLQRWSEGTEPELRTLRKVAHALDRPLLDLLLIAGFVTQDEVEGRDVPIRHYSVEEAIRLDQEISDGEREALRQIHDVFQTAEQGGHTVKMKRTRR